ncbi:MAG: tyrosine-type recombinase/integrase, partial [Actinobacteria bacterium]|nr:tyrosine-type recombinase/integrase [Actinomycetota bacterium]
GPCSANSGDTGCSPTTLPRCCDALAATAGITQRITPPALRRSYITIGLLQGVPLRDLQRAARHAKADTTVAYDQSERSFHKDPTFVLMAATARLQRKAT